MWQAIKRQWARDLATLRGRGSARQQRAQSSVLLLVIVVGAAAAALVVTLR